MASLDKAAARRRLEAQRAELLDRLGMSGDTAPPGGPVPAGGAPLQGGQARGQALRAHSLGLLEQVNNALRHLERGEYGTCQDCGRLIRPERLEALPYATLCVDCSAKAIEA